MLSKLKRRFSNSFTARLMICIFSTSFALLLLGGIIFFQSSLQASAKVNRTMTLENLTVTRANLEQIFKQVDTSVQMSFSQKGVLEATQADFSRDPASHELIRSAFRSVVNSSDAISHICLSSDYNNPIYIQARSLWYRDAASCLEYYGQFTEQAEDGGSTWYFLTPDPMWENRYCFSNVRTIRPLVRDVKESLLVVTVKEWEVAKNYAFLGNDSYIMTDSGMIISAVNKDLIGTAADMEIQRAVQNNQKNVAFLFSRGGTAYYAVYLPTISCNLIVCIRSELLEVTQMFMLIVSVAVLLLGMVLSLLWSKYIASSMTRPLIGMKQVIEEARDGNLEARCVSERHDEIGYLCESFNYMMDDIERYIKELQQQKDQIKENEIRLLQSQINPHLLYNTLDSALYLMNTGDAERSTAVLEQLSQYFKLALQRGNTIVTVEKALDHVQTYLRLQNLCRMKEFTLKVQGDPGLGKAMILHMLLQPVVENSVLHGFDGSFPDGEIIIDLRRCGQTLEIRVTDNGMGMDELELDRLRTHLSETVPGDKGFALWNIAQRIRMSYGPQYGLSVDSEFGEYTTVTLKIPLMQQEREEDGHV